MAVTLEGERPLLALADEFGRVEQRVRGLVAEAARHPARRRRLLAQAIMLLVGLRRRSADEAGPGVETAYLTAVSAVMSLLDDQGPRPHPDAARVLAGSLSRQLDRALQAASDGTRRAFRQVTAETAADAATDAVTGLVDTAGARRTIGPLAAMLCRTIGRHTTSRGTAITIAPGGPQLTIRNPRPDEALCAEHVGRHASAPSTLPPYHPNCDCVAVPAGVSLDEYIRAQRETSQIL